MFAKPKQILHNPNQFYRSRNQFCEWRTTFLGTVVHFMYTVGIRGEYANFQKNVGIHRN